MPFGAGGIGKGRKQGIRESPRSSKARTRNPWISLCERDIPCGSGSIVIVRSPLEDSMRGRMLAVGPTVRIGDSVGILFFANPVPERLGH